uniref:Uncharacterized protein n=1 Tax=Romanomermis culicivorax TaxID=13658 RepID=A0A915L906_ROMCU
MTPRRTIGGEEQSVETQTNAADTSASSTNSVKSVDDFSTICKDVQCRLLALVDVLPSLPPKLIRRFGRPILEMERLIADPNFTPPPPPLPSSDYGVLADDDNDQEKV